MTAGPEGLFFCGGFAQLGKQVLAAIVVDLDPFVVSLALAKVIELVIGFRLSPEDETAGVDFTQHAGLPMPKACTGRHRPGGHCPSATSTSARPDR